MPGAGKTSLIRVLESMGHFVVEEAATDLIAMDQAAGISQPWEDPSFVDRVMTLQCQRQVQTVNVTSDPQFFDRGPLDTIALSRFLGRTPSPALLAEVARTEEDKIYQRTVFFVENLGLLVQSDVRQITLEQALTFEKIHEQVYAEYGYECVKIAPQSIPDRVREILQCVNGPGPMKPLPGN